MKKHMNVLTVLLTVLCSGLMLTTPVHADSNSSSSSSSSSSSTIQVGQRDHIQNNNGDDSSAAKSNIGKAFVTASQNVSGQYEKDAKNLPTGNTPLGNLCAGNVWSYMGMNAPQYASNLSAGNNTDLSQLMTGSSTKLDQGFGDAGSYAVALNALGLDHVKVGATDWNINALGRRIGSILISGGLGCITAVNWLFSIPNKLFGLCANAIDFLHNASLNENNPFAGVAGYFYNLYQAISQLGLIAWVGLFLISFIVAMLGFRFSRGNNAVSAKHGMLMTIRRFVLAVFNILVLPTMVTSVLFGTFAKLGDGFAGDTNAAATYPIYTNLVSFQDWVKHSRLAIPNGVDITCTTSGSKLSPITDTEALAINAEGAGLANAQSVLANANDSNPIGFDGNQDHGFINNSAQQMLNMWGSSTTYNSADFASFARTHCAGGKDNLANQNNDLSKVLASKTYTTDGSLVGHENNAFNSQGANMSITPTTCGVDKGGLSTLGMFNYLNTSTNGSTLTYTDASKLPTENGANQHLSIGLTGRGFTAFANYCLMFASIWVFAIVGIYSGILAIQGAVVGTFKYGIATIKSGTGAIKASAQLVTAAAMMLLEVGGTMILYNVICNILIGVMRGMSTFFAPGSGMTAMIAPHLSGVAYASANMSGFAVYKFMMALIIGVLAFYLLKFRNTLLNGLARELEEAMVTVIGSIGNAVGAEGNYGVGNIARDNRGFSTVDAHGNTVHPLGVDNVKKALNNEEIVNNRTSGNGLSGAGAYDGATTINNPQTKLAKLHNAMANRKDFTDAKNAARGGNSTKAQKRHDKHQYAAMTVAAGAADMTGAHGLASDIRSVRSAKAAQARQDAKAMRGAEQVQPQGTWQNDEVAQTEANIRQEQSLWEQQQAEKQAQQAQQAEQQAQPTAEATSKKVAEQAKEQQMRVADIPDTISDSNDQVAKAQDAVVDADQQLTVADAQVNDANQQVAQLTAEEQQAQQAVDNAQQKADEAPTLVGTNGETLMTSEQRELRDAQTRLASVQTQKQQAVVTQQQAQQAKVQAQQAQVQARQNLQKAQTQAATLAYAKPVAKCVGHNKLGGKLLTNAHAMQTLQNVDRAYSNVNQTLRKAKAYKANHQPVPKQVQRQMQTAMENLQSAKKTALHAGINKQTLVNRRAVHNGLDHIADEITTAQAGQLKGIAITGSHQTRDFRDDEAQTNVADALQFLQK